MGISRGLITDSIRCYLNQKDVLVAVVITAAYLEDLLFHKLFFEKRFPAELIDNWTLSRYIDWTIKLKLIPKEKETLLREFNKLRNRCVHERLHAESLQVGVEDRAQVINMCGRIMDFIDTTPVPYISDPEIEQEYADYIRKRRM